MDPMSALSLACNVITIADAAVTTGRTLWGLYNSTSGFTEETEQVVLVVSQFEKALEALRPARNQLATSASPDLNIGNAVQQCDEIIQAIAAILDQCRVKRTASARAVMKAWFRSNVKHKAALEKLQTDLQSATNQLQMWLAITTR